MQRGSTTGMAPHERNSAYHDARAQLLVDAVPDEHILYTFGGSTTEGRQRCERQTPDPAERREQFRELLLDKGGKSGQGLDAISRAIELLREHALAVNSYVVGRLAEQTRTAA